MHLLLRLHIGGAVRSKKLHIVITLNELVLLSKPNDRTHSGMMHAQPARSLSSHNFYILYTVPCSVSRVPLARVNDLAHSMLSRGL